jgi:signal transduction histidine kinase
MAHHQSSIFSMTEGTDIALLFLVGSITGWLRDQLNRELQRHRSTAEERDQALNELKQSYERVQRAERLAALGQMAAGIAHEVRNPLTSMRGAADILQRSLDKQPERAASLIELLQSEISRLDELTRHFLEFARPPEADRHPLPPHALARESIDMMQTQAKDHSLSISGEISDDTSLVSADRDQLRQVILNLLINAIQNADKGSTIKVTSHFTEGYWRLAISNQGPVIPPEQLERIFEPFFTTHAEGTGLGLAVSARIAEAHNGTLECSSTLSATTFTLSLPESHDAAADSDH